MRDYHVDGLRLDAVHAIVDETRPAHPAPSSATGCALIRDTTLVISEMDDRGPAADRASGATTRSGATSSTTRCTCCSPASTRATTPTTDRSPRSRASYERPDAEALVVVRAEPRPGRQPRVRRPPAAGRAAAARRRSVRSSRRRPLLFMGEEYDEPRPFQFFTDHIDPRSPRRPARAGDASSRASRRSRGDEVPDPQAHSTTFDARSSIPRRATPNTARSTVALLELRRTLPRRTGADDRRRGRALPPRPARRRRARRQFLRRRADGVGPWEGRSDERACGPGRPFPLGAVWDGEGTNFSLFSEHAEACRAVPVRRRRSRDARSRCASAPRSTGTATCPASGPASATRTACTGRTSPSTGQRFNPRSCSSTRTPRRSTARSATARRTCCPYVPDGDDADLVADDEDDQDAIPKSVVVDEQLRLGRRPAAPPPVERDRHLRGPRQGVHQAHPSVREDLRGTYAGLASEEAIAHLVELGVTAVELLPIHHIADEAHLVDKGLCELLGLQLDRLPRAALAVRGDRHARPAAARVQGHGEGAAPRRASR